MTQQTQTTPEVVFFRPSTMVRVIVDRVVQILNTGDIQIHVYPANDRRLYMLRGITYLRAVVTCDIGEYLLQKLTQEYQTRKILTPLLYFYTISKPNELEACNNVTVVELTDLQRMAAQIREHLKQKQHA